MAETVSEAGRSCGLGPGEVQAVREEFSVGGGDESRAGSGLGFNLSQSRSDGLHESGAKSVLIVAG